MAYGNDPDFASGPRETSGKCTFPNRQSERVLKYKLSDSYRLVSWVYACVNVISESISGVPFKFYDGPPDDEGKKEIDSKHPANMLFTPPKPMEIPTREDYIRMVFTNLGCWGEIFSPFKFETGKRYPKDIDVINPYYFEANRNKEGDLTSWKWNRFTPEGHQLPPKILADGEVLQFRYFDPVSKIRGLSPLAPGRLPIEQEINMSVWNAGFFQGGIRNPIVILLKNLLGTGRNRTEFLDQIRRDYTGFVKGHGPLVLEGGADARPLLQSIKDLDFIEGKNLTREEICALYGVPPALVGIFRYANYANSREQTRLFWINTLVPKMRLFRNVIQVGLLDKYWPGVYADFDWRSVDAIEADPVQKATAHNLETSAANTLYNMGYTKEEISIYLDNPKLAGDGKAKPEPKPTPPPSSAPAGPDNGGGSNNKPKPQMPNGRPPKKPKFLGEVSTDSSSLNEYTRKWILSDEEMVLVARDYQETILNHYGSEYLRFVRTFAKNVLDEGASGKPLNAAKWQSQWVDTVSPVLRNTLYAGVETAWKEVCPEAEVVSVPMEDRKSLIQDDNPEKSIEFFARETSQKSFAIVGILSGILSSPNANKLLENPETVIFPLMNQEEAKWVIARVFHHGKMLAQAALGVVKHMWISDNCPQGHENLSGVVIAHWADFPSGAGIHPVSRETQAPLHACTCTTFPAEVVVKRSNK